MNDKLITALLLIHSLCVYYLRVGLYIVRLSQMNGLTYQRTATWVRNFWIWMIVYVWRVCQIIDCHQKSVKHPSTYTHTPHAEMDRIEFIYVEYRCICIIVKFHQFPLNSFADRYACHAIIACAIVNSEMNTHIVHWIHSACMIRICLCASTLYGVMMI